MGKKSSEMGRADTTEADKLIPKSIIIYNGEVGAPVRSLMHEWRRVFLPWSSKRLHATRNKLKDFTQIASTFSVSHLQLFSAPSAGTSLRILRFSNGPTLSFRVESFALRHDIVQSQKRPAPAVGPMYEVAPIVVLNNFATPSSTPEVRLMETTFQSMFPSVNVQIVRTGELQRVVLFHYDTNTGLVEVRHYYIAAKIAGVSKTVKKLAERHVPSKLGTLESIDEALERESAWSDTDGEGEEVELAAPFRSLREQCRIKLIEIGPRLTLRLVKVEDGFGEGNVLFHQFIQKTPEEAAATAARVRARATEKHRRRTEQHANVLKKKEIAEAKTTRKRVRTEEENGPAAVEEVPQ